jgi:hypothetical protein
LKKKRFCDFLGAICLIGCACNLVSQLVLAINRYFNICWNKYFRKLFTIRVAITLCVFCWFASLLVDSPNLLGWGNHTFDVKTANCMWNRLASLSNSLFFSFVAVFTPCLITFSCYLRIFVFVMKSKDRVNSATTQNSGKIDGKSLRIAKSLFSSFVLFLICW